MLVRTEELSTTDARRLLSEISDARSTESRGRDLRRVADALGWLTPVESSARASAQVQAELKRQGEVLSARDTFIAGAAVALDEPLVVADDDFDVSGLRTSVDVEVPYNDRTAVSGSGSQEPDSG